MMKNISLLVVVFFFCSSLMIPTMSYAEDCASCCDTCQNIADTYPAVTPMMLLTQDPGGYDPWNCLDSTIGCGVACCGAFGCVDITTALACIGAAILCWAYCVPVEYKTCQEYCPCCNGCP